MLMHSYWFRFYSSFSGVWKTAVPLALRSHTVSLSYCQISVLHSSLLRTEGQISESGAVFGWGFFSLFFSLLLHFITRPLEGAGAPGEHCSSCVSRFQQLHADLSKTCYIKRSCRRKVTYRCRMGKTIGAPPSLPPYTRRVSSVIRRDLMSFLLLCVCRLCRFWVRLIYKCKNILKLMTRFSKKLSLFRLWRPQVSVSSRLNTVIYYYN